MLGALCGGVLVASALSACSTVSTPVNQEVSLHAVEAGERVEASCDVGNDRASWAVSAPATFGVTRSDQPLTVSCSTSDGSSGSAVFSATRADQTIGGSYGYPQTLAVVLLGEGRRAPTQDQVPDHMPDFAAIDDTAMLPRVGEEGRAGYGRFLAGESPRAFAISDDGHWVRVNAVRGAGEAALQRCRTYGGRCRLYAVDDRVVWRPDRDGDRVAAFEEAAPR